MLCYLGSPGLPGSPGSPGLPGKYFVLFFKFVFIKIHKTVIKHDWVYFRESLLITKLQKILI